MTTLIENAVPLADIAKTMKITVPKVQANAADLDMYVGVDWAGRPAVSVIDAAAYVSGSARRDRDHDAAWRAHLAATEAWEAAREAARRTAFEGAYQASERHGRGSAIAAAAGHDVAREAVRDFERSTPVPVFGDAAPSRLSKMKSRAKESVLR